MNLPRTYEKLYCKENHFGSAVSEILRYKQTDRYYVTISKYKKGEENKQQLMNIK